MQVSLCDKEKCTGCGNCALVCANKSIKMIEDDNGFVYPKIDGKQCMNCGKCASFCPVLNRQNVQNSIDAYLCYSDSPDSREKSASGGFFVELAKHVIENDGVVYGVAYKEDFSVEHCRVGSIEELKCLQKSKYIQSNSYMVFESVLDDLKSGLTVLFSGTPCQVAALKKYLIKDYDNLITMDFECHGISNHYVLKKCIDKTQEERGKKIEKIIMRYKEKHKYFFETGICYLFEDGSKEFYLHNDDYFSRLFFGNVALRESCYNCSFKQLDRVSDFTVGDSWFSEIQTNKKCMDDIGVSKVFVQTEKGKKLIDKIVGLKKFPIDVDLLLKTNGRMMRKSAKFDLTRRQRFFELLKTQDIDNIIDDYCSKGNDRLSFVKRALVNTKIWKIRRDLLVKRSYYNRLKNG